MYKNKLYYKFFPLLETRKMCSESDGENTFCKWLPIRAQLFIVIGNVLTRIWSARATRRDKSTEHDNPQ